MAKKKNCKYPNTKVISVIIITLIVVIFGYVKFFQEPIPRLSLEIKDKNNIDIYLSKEKNEKFDSTKIFLSYEPEKINIKKISVNPEILGILEPGNTQIDNVSGIISIGASLKNLEGIDKTIIATLSIEPIGSNLITPLSFINNSDRKSIFTTVSGKDVKIFKVKYENSPLLLQY